MPRPDPTRPGHSIRRSPRLSRHLVRPAFALFLAAAPMAAQSLPPALSDAWSSVASEHRARVEEAGIVGSTLAFVVDGRVAARQHVGMADLDADRAIDEATLYHWASITKTFTAVAILQLRDRGLLDLDDPAVDYVPELAAAHNPFGDIADVTIRHLLSHSAGFRSPTWPWDGGEAWHPWEPTEWSQLVAMMPYTEVEFAPGSRFQYSNPGIVFLGRVVEGVTGEPFEAWVEKNLFRPLGMATAYFDATPWHLADHRSQNYRVEGGVPMANGDFDTGITVSNGGLNASVDDLARWIAFLTDAVEPGSAAAGVLSRTSLAEMWREVVPVGEMELGHEGMGLAFWLYPDRDLVGHTGSQRGFYSFMLFDPERRRGVLAAFNTAGGDDTGPDTRAVLNAVRKAAADALLTAPKR